jgi:hypothetical protein
MAMKRTVWIAAAIVAASALSAAAQQMTITTPFHGVRDSFFEFTGVGFGLNFPGGNMGGISNDSGRSSIVGFNPFPVGNNLLPVGFAGFDPAGGASFGWGFRGNGFSGGIGISAAQSSDRTMTMAAPSITVTNGVPGFFADVTQRPFVTGLIPVVGGYGGAVMPVYGPGAMMPAYTPGPSVLRGRLARLKNEPGAARQSIAAAQPAEIEEPAGGAAASRLAAARGSSAGQAVESVADIRRRQAKEAEAREEEITELRRKMQEAQAAGKSAIARIYRKQIEQRTGTSEPASGAGEP